MTPAQAHLNQRGDTAYRLATEHVSHAVDASLRAMHCLHEIDSGEECDFTRVADLIDCASGQLAQARAAIGGVK